MIILQGGEYWKVKSLNGDLKLNIFSYLLDDGCLLYISGHKSQTLILLNLTAALSCSPTLLLLQT